MFCQILLNDLITKLKYAIVSLVNIMKLCINDKKIELKEANTFFKELRGLMFKKHINYALKFRCNGIHTFFMKSNIDVILTDKHNNASIKLANKLGFKKFGEVGGCLIMKCSLYSTLKKMVFINNNLRVLNEREELCQN